jgi:hypothetical protein
VFVKFLSTFVMALFVFALAINASAQNSGITCEKFRLRLATGAHVSGTKGVLTNDGFTGVRSDGTPITLKLDEIRSLDRQVGTQAGKGALIGGGIGLLSVFSALLNISSDENSSVDDSKILPVAVGFTAGGALIGMAVGSASSRWQHVSLAMPISLTGHRGLQLTFGFNF